MLASVTTKDRRGDQTMWQFSALIFLFLPGCITAQDPVTGPEEVSGHEQGSLTVQCRYASGWEDYRKYWCRGSGWRSCEILVETDASERLAKKNRVSIRDDQTNFIFTVTMEDLRMSDADVYWCGITKVGRDPMFEVRVSIDPAPESSTTRTTESSTTITTESSTTIMTTMPTVLTSIPPNMENAGHERLIQNSPFIWPLLSSVSFQLLAFVVLPLLVSMLSAILWVNRPQRRSGEVKLAG